MTRTATPALLAGAIGLLAACASYAPAPSRDPVVVAPSGTVQGHREGSLRVFKGIPYAQPPVGELRWKAPVPAAAMPGTRVAKEFGKPCIQPTPKLQTVYSQDIGPASEDCLTLNVWAPAEANDAPVFVWIHGGALRAGSSKEPMYDGAGLAARGLIVVSINYRLGALGYLTHPALSAESPLGVSGNYGLLDQVEALRWVQRNIGAFGGDPANVTIAGESAGALSVMYLMASPAARGLFAKAIAQSAYLAPMPPLAMAEAGGTRLADTLKASDLAALRALDAQVLTDSALGIGLLPWGTVDGKILPRQPIEIFDRGEQAPVPLLAGYNSGEIRSLTMLLPPAPASAADYEALIRDRYLDLADEFLRLYPSTDLRESMLATARDAIYGWTSERMVRKQAALGQSSFLYLWDHGYDTADAANLHAFHASELPYVFGTLDRTPPLWPKIPATARETALSEALLDYWSSFARSGQPAAANAPAWPAYGTSGAALVFRDGTAQAVNSVSPGMFALHEETVCRHRAASEPWLWNAGVASTKLATPCR